MWVRGLKPEYQARHDRVQLVAPRVGAWIETDYDEKKKLKLGVAPRVGAWIETIGDHDCVEAFMTSHPVWVRGLKHYIRSVT